MLSKLSLLLPLLWQQPTEFVARLMAIVDVTTEKHLHPPSTYQSIQIDQAISKVDSLLGWKLAEYRNEAACQAITQQVQLSIENLPANAPFNRIHNSDFSLAQTCYALCRELKPHVVIETGVAYGVTSSFILSAMAENKMGMLYSIDLPPLGLNANDFVGILVPHSVRARWQLMRGTSRKLLPSLAKAVAPIDLFIHDSLHTYRNITFELDTVMPLLNRPAAIVVDDANDNSAFVDWQHRHKPMNSFVIHEEKKDALFGLAIYDS